MNLRLSLAPLGIVSGGSLGFRGPSYSPGGDPDTSTAVFERIVAARAKEFDVEGDQVVGLMRVAWHASKGGVKQIAILDELLETCLELAKDGPTIRPGTSPDQARLILDCLDPALILCWYLEKTRVAESNYSMFPSLPRYPGELLRRRVRECGGLAEHHLHLNAALTSELAWIELTRTSLERAANRFVPAPGGAPTRDVLLGDAEAECDDSILAWGQLSRLLLERFFAEAQPNAPRYGEWRAAFLERFLKGAGQQVPSKVQELLAVLRDIEQVGFEALQDSSVLLFSALRVLRPSEAGADRSTEVSVSERLARERRLVVRLLLQLRREEDSELCETAFRYLLVRNLFHRDLVFGSERSGLESFQRVFRRGSRFAKSLFKAAVGNLSTAMDQLDGGKETQWLEFRIATRTDASAGREVPLSLDAVAAVASQLAVLEHERNSPRPVRAGLVCHFLRHSERQCTYSPNQEYWDSRWREAQPFSALAEEAEALVALLRLRCAEAERVVGIDVAGDEEQLPNWLLLLVMRRLLVRLAAVPSEGDEAPRSIGLCFHVGERFSHILLGLRRVDQVVALLRAGQCDRMGHVIAIDRRIPRQLEISARNEEWLSAMTACRQRLAEAGMVHEADLIKPEVDSLLRALTDVVIESQSGGRKAELLAALQASGTVCEAFKALEDPSLVFALGYPRVDPEEAWSRCRDLKDRLVVFFLADRTYRSWADERKLRSDPAAEVLQSYRQLVVSGIEKKSITIESCPTSNLRIPIAVLPRTYSSHPAIQEFRQQIPGARISLSTDDPLQFATNLGLENWVLFDCISNQSGERAALNWLDERIRDGREASFVWSSEGSPAWLVPASSPNNATERVTPSQAPRTPMIEDFLRS